MSKPILVKADLRFLLEDVLVAHESKIETPCPKAKKKLRNKNYN